MFNRTVSGSLFLLFLGLEGNCARQMIVTSAITEIFTTPELEGEVYKLAQKEEVFEVLDKFFDDSGTVWFRIKVDQDSNKWVDAKLVRYLKDDQQADEIKRKVQEDASDKKRRYGILRKHPDWPRRIVERVRSGQICLGMTMEQIRASWGNPDKEQKGFMVGIGEYTIWFYNFEKSPVIVSLEKGTVTGWSE